MLEIKPETKAFLENRIVTISWYTIPIEHLCLVLVLLKISLSISLSPRHVWFFLNTQSFLATRHTKTSTLPLKITQYSFRKPNLKKIYYRLENLQISLYI